MGKKENLQAKLDLEQEDDDSEKPSNSLIVLDSSDDEEGNEDLSSKIVAKALSRKSKMARYKPLLDESTNSGVVGSRGVIDLTSSSSQEGEVIAVDSGSNGGETSVSAVVDGGSKKKSKKVRKKKKKNVKIDFEEDELVDAVKEDDKIKLAIEAEVTQVEPTPTDTSDNIVLRKLLRGPRYFDPPDSSWGTCYNCGEEGHSAVNCTASKRKKPCFVCGSLEHNFKQCSKGRDCYICKKGGHRAKDCPEKLSGVSQSSKICLICGRSGHEMFSCRNDYSPDDLKEIQCYVCKSFGHLCCFNSIDTGPREVSCYKCGQLGHTGLACGRILEERTWVGTPSLCFRCGEQGHFARECTHSAKVYVSQHVTAGETPNLCFRCGEQGHFARECTHSAKVGKRSRELSTPTRTVSKRDKAYLGFKSEPRDLGKAHKKKKTYYEEREITTPRSVKRRGGWLTEDPGDLPHRKAKVDSWNFPGTPTNRGHKMSTYTAGGQSYGSGSSKKAWKHYSGASTSQGSANAYKHRYSASRFGNSSSDGRTRNYDWW